MSSRLIPYEALLLILGLCSLPAFSAQPVTEGFTSNANGWVGTHGGIFGRGANWKFTGEVARLTFNFSALGLPYSGYLSNGPTASSGSFTGNYDTAGISSIGFSIFCETYTPSLLSLKWGSATQQYVRDVGSGLVTGAWLQVNLPLDEGSKYEWVATPSNYAAFAQTRREVSTVVLQVDAAGEASAHAFLLDNLMLAWELNSIASDPSDANLSRLQGFCASNQLYNVEGAPHPTGTWSVVQSFTATGLVHTVTVTNTSDLLFWRFTRP